MALKSSGFHPRRSPVGIYEGGLLCERCDSGLLGTLDQHAAEALLQSKPRDQNFLNARTRIYTDADPVLLHRFILSVAWRASISSHPFFSTVKLGPYQERIRLMLLDPSLPTEPLETMVAEFDTEHLAALNPHHTKMGGVRIWTIYANRFVFYLKASNMPMPADLSALVLRPGAPVRTLVREYASSKEFSLTRRIATANPKAFKRR